jgi:hypothetical protein
MSKARDLANLLGGGGSGVPSFSGTGAIDVPAGTTAQRPSNPNTGYVRFNTTLDQLEQYTSESGWQGISAPPTISDVDVSSFDYDQTTQTVVISGQNFDATASGSLIDANGVTLTPTTSTRNSSSQITIVLTGGDRVDGDTPEPLDVKITNGSGLTAIIENAISINDTPAWTTASGSVGTVYEDATASNIQLQASDIETGGSISYSISAGALPSGMSMSSSGLISGTPNENDTYSASGVTHNFTVTATGTDGDTTPRAFSILRKWLDGSTSALATTTSYLASNNINVSSAYLQAPSGYSAAGVQQYDIYLDSTNADCYIKLPGEWLDQYGNYIQLVGNGAWNWNSQGAYNRGFSITSVGAFDMDLRWSFTKYFVYMHSTVADDVSGKNPDDTKSFLEAQFTGITSSISAPSGGHTNSYVSRSETDANGNSLTLTPAALVLNAYSPSNDGVQTFAIGTPENIHPWKRGGEFAPNFINQTSSNREVMFNMMPGSGYTNGTLSISGNNAGTAPTNYRNFPAATGATTKFRVAYYDNGDEIIRIPDVEIWVNGT